LFVLGGLLLQTPIVFADNAENAPDSIAKMYSIGEVEIVGAYRETEIIPPKKLDGVVLENLSCQSVADAVRYFSGVQIKDYGGVGGIKTINIRSMGTNQMGVFYDGIQLGNAQNGQIDLGRFSLDNMEAIELYNGQKSSMLQPAKDYGSAGTIYLQTKTPKFADGKRFHFGATFKTGSFGLANPALLWQQKIGRSASSSASVEYIHANGRYKFRHKRVNADGTIAYDTTAIRKNADINAIRSEISFCGTITDGEWKAHLYNYYSERGLPGYIARNLYEHHQRQWDDNFFVQSSFRKDFTSYYSLLANGKYAYDYTHYLNPDTTLQYINNTYRQQEIYLSLANSFRIFKWWEAALSTDFQWNTLASDMVDFVFPIRYTGLIALATAIKFPNIKMQAGLLSTFTHETVKRKKPAPDKQAFTPSVMATVRPWKHILFDIQFFYKRIFRMPTFNDLYYTFVGNAQLNPEYVSQYDFGLSYTYQSRTSAVTFFNVSTNLYYNDVDDKIVAVPTANPFRWQMTNLGKVKILGVDVSLKSGFQWCKHWNLDLLLNYTYQDARDLTDPNEAYYGDQIPYTPWHSGSVVGNLKYKTWNLNYSFIYTGERYNQSANIIENYVLPWYTHDLSLSKQFILKKVKLTAAAEVNNLFNQQYDVVLNYPMPGTNFKLILKAEL